jgi:hypothetical protein
MVSAGRAEYDPERALLGQRLCGAFFKTLKREAGNPEGRRTKKVVRAEIFEYILLPYYS